MAKLADARDLKSRGARAPYGFDSRFRHQLTVSAPKAGVSSSKIRTLSHDGGVQIYLYMLHQTVKSAPYQTIGGGFSLFARRHSQNDMAIILPVGAGALDSPFVRILLFCVADTTHPSPVRVPPSLAKEGLLCSFVLSVDGCCSSRVAQRLSRKQRGYAQTRRGRPPDAPFGTTPFPPTMRLLPILFV